MFRGSEVVMLMVASESFEREFGEENARYTDELSPGTILLSGQYSITEYLNNGGFGITYLAKDSLDRNVVIKECFPSAMCRRTGNKVQTRSRAHTASFAGVVKLFQQEARNQAKLSHRNIAAVHQVFSDNNTAYMAVDYIDGSDMMEIIEDGMPIAPEVFESWLRKSLVAVQYIHDRGILHRDISPDNILIDTENEPVFIDFGSARDLAVRKTRVLSTLRVVKSGYSPHELYVAGCAQTPSSDLYSLAATFYHLISGEPPVDSQMRLSALALDQGDPYTPLTGRFGEYPEVVLKSIDAALNVFPDKRIQSATEWLELLDASSAPTSSAERSETTDVEHDNFDADETASNRGFLRTNGLRVAAVFVAALACALALASFA
ncbi:serine/threonine-protein kinase [Defluviimonas aestuarii]|uniref:serine/threonine-protein kinase n=1 Tax=Albidovulum aestuarii TaxID=1130726 RepID=UPI00249C9E31|nr:serine/threonine-protein kinase [Defluviimonas aestuarii]